MTPSFPTRRSSDLMEARARQDGGDASAAFLDVGMGLAFGGLAHLQAPRVIGKAEAAALLTANNAHHFRNGTTPGAALDTARSEEHTSELQSLMRISYAVFCLKKKKNTNTQHTCRLNISQNNT